LTRNPDEVTTMSNHLRAAFALIVTATTVATVSAQPPSAPAAAKPGINKPFENPNVHDYVAKFETGTREVYARREAIVRALELKKGMAVGDVGAGTGAFTRLIADRVGPEGKVYAVDISKAFLEHIARESERLGQSQVKTVQGSQESIGLGTASIDLAFLCDVYHHLENPSANLGSIRAALKPGGVLAVVDFDRVKGQSSEFVLEHVRADKSTFAAEIRAAGFIILETPNAPSLKENFFLRFRKGETPASKKQEPEVQ
jgi:ubiquinone/menaquinone biosynthesis C-methylase UbiE